MTSGDTESAIRERAYRLWEAEGRPDGRAQDHWYMAMQELFATTPIGSEAMPTLDAAEIVSEAPMTPVKAAKSKKPTASAVPPSARPKMSRGKAQPSA